MRATRGSRWFRFFTGCRRLPASCGGGRCKWQGLKKLLKSYKPEHGPSSLGRQQGAILTAEVAAKLKQLGLPMPAALGIFSGMGDFARNGDSISLYALRGFSGHLDPPVAGAHDPFYVASTDVKDPILSPIYGDLHGLPPTLFVTSGRDLLLSGTANLHRAYLAGVESGC